MFFRRSGSGSGETGSDDGPDVGRAWSRTGAAIEGGPVPRPAGKGIDAARRGVVPGRRLRAPLSR